MVSVKKFVDTIKCQGIDFFTGVPDSLLKSFCAYLQDNEDKTKNVIAANEGAAIALAAGHYLAAGRPGCVYMQNSGIGNAVNPLLSLVDSEVYKIPLLLIIGWRGEPGVHDEPQHVKQGAVTLSLLSAMGIPYVVLSDDNETALVEVKRVCNEMKSTGVSHAIIIRKGIFDTYKLHNKIEDISTLPRERAIEIVLEKMPNDGMIVSTTGMISRELYELRRKRGEKHDRDFLTVGSMGHASQIALGISMDKPIRVVCMDGDGATLMHMGSLAIIGNIKPSRFVHIVFNNAAHDSVGGQPTVASEIELREIAQAVGYAKVFKAYDEATLQESLKQAFLAEGPVFVEVKVMKGARKDLGRPTTTPIQNKEALMAYISNLQ